MSFLVPIRKNLLPLKPYVPGRPLEEVERELGIPHASKLASNENPLGPSSKVLEALQAALPKVHRYPDGAAHNLSLSLSQHLKVPAETLILGNGSNELIVRLGQIVLGSGDEVLYADPGFFVYYSTALLCDAVPRPIPLRDFTHDLDAFEKSLTPRTRVVFLANPNNPTGTSVPWSRVEAFLRACSQETLVVLDEAYFEYVDDPSYQASLDLLSRYPNLVVLRTFSKAYGLAGLRVGYGLAHPELAKVFQKVREPFNVNSLALVAAEAALKDQAHLQKVLDLNRIQRDKLFKGLEALGASPVPSRTNFVYFEWPEATALYEDLLKLGLITRPMGPRALRITTGTEKETEDLLTALKDLLPKRRGRA